MGGIEKPHVAICCGTCRYADKKITDEPCINCRWCNKWEENIKESKTMDKEITIEDVKQKIIDKMYEILTNKDICQYGEVNVLADAYYTLDKEEI